MEGRIILPEDRVLREDIEILFKRYDSGELVRSELISRIIERTQNDPFRAVIKKGLKVTLSDSKRPTEVTGVVEAAHRMADRHDVRIKFPNNSLFILMIRKEEL